jgi:hypothetical protein
MNDKDDKAGPDSSQAEIDEDFLSLMNTNIKKDEKLLKRFAKV